MYIRLDFSKVLSLNVQGAIEEKVFETLFQIH